MRIKVRAKQGGSLVVLDENDRPVEGVVSVCVRGDAGVVPSVDLVLRGVDIVTDVYAPDQEQRPVPRRPRHLPEVTTADAAE